MGLDYSGDYLRRDVEFAPGRIVNFPSPFNSFRIGLPDPDRRFVLVLSLFPQDIHQFFFSHRLETFTDYPGPHLCFYPFEYIYRSKVKLSALMPLQRRLEKDIDYRRLYDFYCLSRSGILYSRFTVWIYSTIFTPLWNTLDPQFADFWIRAYLLWRLANGCHRHSCRLLLLPGISIDR